MSKKWQTIERTVSDGYDIQDSMYNKANEYFLLVSIVTSDNRYPVALLPTIYRKSAAIPLALAMGM